MENSENIENLENTENPDNKKEIVAPDKEESVALKDNKEVTKEGTKKKKSKKISLEKLKLGTKPINISSSNDYFNFNYIYYFLKSRIRMISYMAVGIIVAIIILTLKGIFHSETEEEKNQIVDNKGITPPVKEEPNILHNKKKKKTKKKKKKKTNL